jgi:hypothetical protein
VLLGTLGTSFPLRWRRRRWRLKLVGSCSIEMRLGDGCLEHPDVILKVDLHVVAADAADAAHAPFRTLTMSDEIAFFEWHVAIMSRGPSIPQQIPRRTDAPAGRQGLPQRGACT